MDAELQQRAVEYLGLERRPDVAARNVTAMPPWEKRKSLLLRRMADREAWPPRGHMCDYPHVLETYVFKHASMTLSLGVVNGMIEQKRPSVYSQMKQVTCVKGMRKKRTCTCVFTVS